MACFRITYLLLDGRFFGGVKSTLEQAHRLAERGHDVQVLTIGPEPDWMRPRIPVRRVVTFSPATVPESDFIIGTYWVTVRPAFEIRRGIPLHYCRGYEGHGVDPATVRLSEIRLAYALPTCKIVNSSWNQRFLRDEFGARCWHVPNAVDCARFSPATTERTSSHDAIGPPASPWRILLVGPGTFPAKGIAAGLDAVRILRDRGHHVELIRVSQVPMTTPENESGLIDRWLGRVAPSSMPLVYRNADLLLGTSVDETEGFFMPAVEAMACGVPVVLTDVPCHHEYAPGDGHALFVPPNDPVAMADAAERVMTESSLRARLSGAGRNVARQLEWEPHLDRLESVLEEIRSEYGTGYAISRTCTVPGFSHPLREAVHRTQYEFAGTMVEGERVLDVGCGTGHGAAFLADAGARSVLAIDHSPAAIAYAEDEYPDDRVTFQVMDPTRLIVPSGSVDLVTALGLVDHVEDRERFLDEAARVLNQRGALLLSVANPRRPLDGPHSVADGPPDGFASGEEPGLRFPPSFLEELDRLLAPHFGHVVWFGQRITDEGISIRPGDLDPENDISFLALATQPQPRTLDVPFRVIEGTLAGRRAPGDHRRDREERRRRAA